MSTSPTPIKQEFRMTWVFFITLPILLVSIGFSLILPYIQSQKTNNPLNASYFMSWETLPPILIALTVLLMLYNIRLIWEIDENGFRFRYHPFVNKTRNYPFSEIERIQYEKINPLRDFGGWGLRYSKKYGKAYTTQGNHVLRITLKSGEIRNFTAKEDPQIERWNAFINPS